QMSVFGSQLSAPTLYYATLLWRTIQHRQEKCYRKGTQEFLVEWGDCMLSLAHDRKRALIDYRYQRIGFMDHWDVYMIELAIFSTIVTSCLDEAYPYTQVRQLRERNYGGSGNC
ncbi:MAG: hypothetical protein ACXAEN_26595, partial [Candidatus Thorarchaeota archaeon]